MDCQGQEFVTLVTRHICLNLFAEQQSDGVEALARYEAALPSRADAGAIWVKCQPCFHVAVVTVADIRTFKCTRDTT